MKDLLPIEVEWEDASCSSGKFYLPLAIEIASEALIIHDIGYLIDKTPDYIAYTEGYNWENGEIRVDSVHRIPMSLVRKFRFLKRGKK